MRADPAMAHVAANGLDIGYDEAGDGPPLILLHSASSSGREDFAAQVPLLRRSFHCLLPDARGHATTRWDAADGFRYDWLVDDLEAFVDALDIDTFHLLGFSMGAMTALGFAVRAPARLRSLVVVGISPQREPRQAVARRLMDPAFIEQDPAWAATLSRRHDPVQGVGAWQRLMPAIARDIGEQALLTPVDLVRVTMPALVAVGDHDPFVPVDQAWALKRQLPNASLLVAPDCGHEVPAKRASLFNDALSGFYRSLGVTAERATIAPW